MKDEGYPCYIGGLIRGTLYILPLPPPPHIVRELLEVCATSAPSKRVFSAGQVVVTYKRACLTAKSIETVNCWLRGNNIKWYDNVHDEDADMRVVADEIV